MEDELQAKLLYETIYEENEDMAWEQIIDIFLLMDIMLSFICSFKRENDSVWSMQVKHIAWNYLKGTLLFDVMGTLPCLVTG